MNKIREFILDLMIGAFLGMAIGITLKEREINKENERLNKDIKQIEWVKSAKLVQPQNNLINGVESDGNK